MNLTNKRQKSQHLRLITFLLFMLSIVFLQPSSPVLAETPAEKGLAIAIEADEKDLGYGDLTADMLMTLRNKHGQESKRKMRFRSLEIMDDGDKSLIIFTQLDM